MHDAKTLDASHTPFKAIDERRDTAPPHPGEYLREDVLPHFRLTRTAAARVLNISPEALQAILDERAHVTPELAAALEKAFGLNAATWRGFQLQYDLWHSALETPAHKDKDSGDADLMGLI